jgi:hypothetical protein
MYNDLIENINQIKDALPAAKVGTTALNFFFFSNIQIMSADNLSSKLKEYTIVAGPDILLEGESVYSARGELDSKDLEDFHLCLAKFLAQAIIEIEHNDFDALQFITDGKHDKEGLETFEKKKSKRIKMLRDLTHDGDRSITRFFAKIISCTCL